MYAVMYQAFICGLLRVLAGMKISGPGANHSDELSSSMHANAFPDPDLTDHFYLTLRRSPYTPDSPPVALVDCRSGRNHRSPIIFCLRQHGPDRLGHLIGECAGLRTSVGLNDSSALRYAAEQSHACRRLLRTRIKNPARTRKGSNASRSKIDAFNTKWPRIISIVRRAVSSSRSRRSLSQIIRRLTPKLQRSSEELMDSVAIPEALRAAQRLPHHPAHWS